MSESNVTPVPSHPGAGTYEAQLPDIMLWENANPRALVNLVPASMRTKLEDAKFTNEELFDIVDEASLYKKLVEDSHTPTATDNRIRIRFWMEYDYCQLYHTKGIDIARVIAGIVSFQFFSTKYLANARKAAWLMCPPAGYMTKANEALEFGLLQLRDILQQPHVVGGRVDTKLGELKAKIVAMLDTRVKGAIVQKSIALNAHSSAPGVAQAVAQSLAPPTMDQLQKRLDHLKREQYMLGNGGAYEQARAGARPKEEAIEVVSSSGAERSGEGGKE